MFDELPARTLSSYNYLISENLKHGQVEESLSLVRRLVLSGESPAGYAFSMILKASTCLGRMVHARIIKSDVEGDIVDYTALVASYIKNGRVGYARRVYDMMLDTNIVCSTGYMRSVEDAEDIFRRTVEKDVVVFIAMIEGYRKSVGCAKKSIEVYIDMQRLKLTKAIRPYIRDESVFIVNVSTLNFVCL